MNTESQQQEAASQMKAVEDKLSVIEAARSFGVLEAAAWVNRCQSDLVAKSYVVVGLRTLVFTASTDQHGAGAAQSEDGKAAARYSYLRATDWDEIQSIFWSHEVQSGGNHEECQARLDAEIDARILKAKG